MRAVYVQRGENLDYKNTGDVEIPAGSIVVFGNHMGIAGTTIAPGDKGSLITEGVYKVPKKAGEKIDTGMDVYYSEDGMTALEEDGTAPAESGDAPEKKEASTAGDSVTDPEGSTQTEGDSGQVVKVPAGYAVADASEEDLYVMIKLFG